MLTESLRKKAFNQKKKKKKGTNQPRPLDLRQDCQEEQKSDRWREGLCTTLQWAEVFS